MFTPRHSIERLLWWLIAGTKGGKTRATVIVALRELPRNANQLANELKLDYKTITHHLGVLASNGIISSVGKGYGTTYFLSPELEENFQMFEVIWKKIGKNENKRNSRRVKKR